MCRAGAPWSPSLTLQTMGDSLLEAGLVPSPGPQPVALAMAEQRKAQQLLRRTEMVRRRQEERQRRDERRAEERRIRLVEEEQRQELQRRGREQLQEMGYTREMVDTAMRLSGDSVDRALEWLLQQRQD